VYRVFVDNVALGTRDLCPLSVSQKYENYNEWWLGAQVYDYVSHIIIEEPDKFCYNDTEQYPWANNHLRLLNTTVVIGWDLNPSTAATGGMLVDKYNVYVADEEHGDYDILGVVDIPGYRQVANYSVGGIFAFHGCNETDFVNSPNRDPLPSRYFKVSAVTQAGESPLSDVAEVFCGQPYPKPDQNLMIAEVVAPVKDYSTEGEDDIVFSKDGPETYDTMHTTMPAEIKLHLPWHEYETQDFIGYHGDLVGMEIELLIEENVKSIDDRGKFFVYPADDLGGRAGDIDNRNPGNYFLNQYYHVSKEYLPFSSSDFAKPVPTDYVTPYAETETWPPGNKPLSGKNPYKFIRYADPYYGDPSRDPYQTLVNQWNRWQTKKAELMNEGGNFGLQLYDRVTITDPHTKTYTFTNLKEGYVYYVKYALVSRAGRSMYSDLKYVFLSRVPQKIYQPYGIHASLEECGIGWRFNTFRDGLDVSETGYSEQLHNRFAIQYFKVQ